MSYLCYYPQVQINQLPVPITFPKGVDSFRASIIMFVETLEMEPKQNYTISQLCTRFAFQRRRFYDVVNVLEAAGCCQKTNFDCFTWLGLANVKPHLAQLIRDHELTTSKNDMEELFPTSESITIANLAYQFLLAFLALDKKLLDIKQIALFLSRNNSRFKTTLCKLYQISHILEVVGIIEKTITPGEVLLAERFFPDKPSQNHVFMDVGMLLNGTKKQTASEVYADRWNTFTKVHELPQPMVLPILSPITSPISV